MMRVWLALLQTFAAGFEWKLVLAQAQLEDEYSVDILLKAHYRHNPGYLPLAVFVSLVALFCWFTAIRRAEKA